MSVRAPRLLLVTPALPAADLERRVEAALSSAHEDIAVLLRQPGATDAALVSLALTLRRLTHDRGAGLLISGRADVAVLVDADGVHLPESGLSVADARHLLPQGALVGCSRHDAEGLKLAQDQGADYATLSPVYNVPDKGSALGVAAFAECLRAVRLPVLALGGIAPNQISELLRAGAYGVAVTRAGLGADDEAAAIEALGALLWR